jgi:hypothetical protein
MAARERMTVIAILLFAAVADGEVSSTTSSTLSTGIASIRRCGAQYRAGSCAFATTTAKTDMPTIGMSFFIINFLLVWKAPNSPGLHFRRSCLNQAAEASAESQL